MTDLPDIINSCFSQAYPGHKPVWDEETLKRRVKMITEDLICTRQSWHNTEVAYAKLDARTRGIRLRWWQFWRHSNNPPRPMPKETNEQFAKREAQNIMNSADAQCFRWLLKHHSGSGKAMAGQGMRCWIGGVEFHGEDIRDAIVTAIDREELVEEVKRDSPESGSKPK